MPKYNFLICVKILDEMKSMPTEVPAILPIGGSKGRGRVRDALGQIPSISVQFLAKNYRTCSLEIYL